MLNAAHIFPHNTPTTKEAYYYRMIFERFFPQVCLTQTNLELLYTVAYFMTLDKIKISFISIHWIKFLNILQNSARLTVPGGASVACSTAKAIEWDASWSNNLDPSGRAALGVHNSAYDPKLPSISSENAPSKIINSIPQIIGAPELIIRS